MRTKVFIAALCFNSFCFAQTQVDSTAIKNQALIEQLKNRINTIDNIGNGTNSYQKQIDELKVEMARQNDSIIKLLTIINDLKRYATNSKTSQSSTPSLTIDSEKDVVNRSNKLTDRQYNNLKDSEAFYQEYIKNCNCAAIFYKPYQVELNFETIVALEELIKQFETNAHQKITILGHADRSGDEAKNVMLSKQRAESLKKYLIIASSKIKSEDVIIEWYGSSRPIQSLPQSKKQFNRRTEITLK
jgi:flagellar motor protein MotB